MLMNISSPCQGGLFGSLGLSSSPLFYGKREERVRRVERERDLTGFACNEGSWSLLRKLLTEGGWRGPVFPLISQNYTISRARCGVTPFVFASDEGGGRSDRHRHIPNLINEKSFDP